MFSGYEELCNAGINQVYRDDTFGGSTFLLATLSRRFVGHKKRSRCWRKMLFMEPPWFR